MKITCKDKNIDIPNWVIVVGLLVADSIACNICKVKVTKKLSSKEGES